MRRGCVFSRSAATNHCTDHRIHVVIPRQHNNYYQPMLTKEHVILPSSILTIEGQSVIFTILSSQLATPLHISWALDIQLDACTTSDRQGNRVPIVKSVTFINNGEELRGGRRRRPRGEEFPPYGFCRCTIPFPCSITLLNFSFFWGGYHGTVTRLGGEASTYHWMTFLNKN